MTKHTPGPWAWFGNTGSKTLYLATTHSGRKYVMGFKRWGMNGAQPMFQPNNGVVPASELVKFEVGDHSVVGCDAAKSDPSVYRYDVSGIDCADARLIAAAPELYEAIKLIRGIIMDASPEGFNPHVGDWAERLYESQGVTARLMRKVEGDE